MKTDSSSWTTTSEDLPNWLTDSAGVWDIKTDNNKVIVNTNGHGKAEYMSEVQLEEMNSSRTWKLKMAAVHQASASGFQHRQ